MGVTRKQSVVEIGKLQGWTERPLEVVRSFGDKRWLKLSARVGLDERPLDDGRRPIQS